MTTWFAVPAVLGCAATIAFADPIATQGTSATRKQPAELTFTGCLHEESPETAGAGRTTHYVLHDLAHASASEDVDAVPSTRATARLIIANDSTIRRLIGRRVQVTGRPGDFDATTRSPELHVTSLRGIDGTCAAPEPVR